MAGSDVPAPPSATAAPLPRLAPGTELLGRYQDSAYQDPRFLLRRSDGQVMQLPGLLYRVAASLDGRGAAEVAAQLSAEFGRELTAEQVVYLVDDRLRPVGVVADAAPARAPVRADPLLALRHRVTVLPASAAQRVGRLLGPLYLRPVWVLHVAAFLAGAVWIARHDLLGALVAGVRQTALQPGYVLAILALTVAGAAFHECGHVAACSYGGARPGDLGVGLYVLWPAFYSTVTDSYRLGRAGRVRTDLGGIYFNVVLMAGVEAVHLATGSPWLLIALVGMLVQTAWQFLPSLRLDGYYILADLVGVPELFGFVRPALLSLLPGRPVHPGVLALRPAARRWVQAWVLAAVPTLLAGGVTLLLALPRLVPAAVQAAGGYLERLGAAARGGDVVATGAGVVELLVLALPWVGLLLLLGSVGRLLARLLLRGWTPGTRARARRVLRGAVVGTALGALGAAVVARIGWAALTLPPTDGQTRAGTWPARWQLAGWDRLTAASTRHPAPVAGAREVAVLACAVLVATALALVAAGRVRVLAVALPLAAVGALGPVVTALATGGPGLLGAAEVAVGTVVLCSVRRGSGVLAGLLAVGAGVATAPVLGVPLVLGAALLVDRRRRGPAGRHRAERARGGRHRRPTGGSPGPRRWGSSPVAFPAAALAGAPVVHRAPHLRTSSAGWAGGHPR